MRLQKTKGSVPKLEVALRHPLDGLHKARNSRCFLVTIQFNGYRIRKTNEEDARFFGNRRTSWTILAHGVDTMERPLWLRSCCIDVTLFKKTREKCQGKHAVRYGPELSYRLRKLCTGISASQLGTLVSWRQLRKVSAYEQG